MSAILAEAVAYTAQSVTTGRTGNLVRVELEVSRRRTFEAPWILDIQEVLEGKPSGKVLSSTIIDPRDFSVDAGSFEPPVVVDLSTPVFFKVGDPFAIVLHPKGVEGSNPRLFAGAWKGGCWDVDGFSCYRGGTAFSGPDAKSLSPENFDLRFSTYVSEVPLPAAIWLFAWGIGALLVGRGVRRKA
jgi:hypothetical protein